jgi:hypothetical protein
MKVGFPFNRLKFRREKNALSSIAAALAGSLSVANSLYAGTISESVTAPSANILTSQLTDLGPGAQDSNGDYTDNSGPVGETFHISSNANITAITILGNGDSSTDSSLFFHFEVGTFNAVTGQITQLSADTAPETATENSTGYLTFTFGTPVPVTAGSNYEFSIWSETNVANGGNWFGLAHSAPGTHPGDGGESFNYDTSTTNHDNNTDGIGKNAGWASTGFVAPNINNYEYAFAVQGTAVPEPASASLLGLGAVAFLTRRRR